MIQKGRLWWRTDDKYAPVTMFVNCNDLFFWATSDLQEITLDNINSLEETVKEVRSISDTAVEDAPLLWCCRQRKMKPQQPYYKHLDKNIHHLFNACSD